MLVKGKVCMQICIHEEGHRFTISHRQTHICCRCGLEEQFLEPNTTDYLCHTLVTPYSRVARFRELLEKLLGMSNGPLQRDPIWQYLAKSAPFRCSRDIYSAIKLSGLKNKHYSDLHIFCKCFLEGYQAPLGYHDVHFIHTRFVNDFNTILFQWNRKGSSSFFSYNWVLEKLFQCYGIIAFDSYLKKLQCPTRRSLYERLWTVVTTGDELGHLRPCPDGTPLTLLEIA